jgi:hypothetical protein
MRGANERQQESEKPALVRWGNSPALCLFRLTPRQPPAGVHSLLAEPSKSNFPWLRLLDDNGPIPMAETVYRVIRKVDLWAA